MSTMITFYYPYPDLIDAVRGQPPDSHPDLYSRGEIIWVVQTYHRLRERGLDVELSAQPTGRVVVYHADSSARLFEAVRSTPGDPLTVCARADREREPRASFEIVQNGLEHDGVRTYWIPHWPQPGLRPRNPDRGSTLSVAGYMGQDSQLHPWFSSDVWRDYCRDRGLDWRPGSRRWEEMRHGSGGAAWTGFQDLDVFIAVRPRNGFAWSKPASKLVNAWLAGVPALLGREYAYGELRRSPLDYVRLNRPEDAMRAIDELMTDPRLYEAMRRHGGLRAAEYMTDRITDRWVEVLTGIAQASGWRLAWARASQPVVPPVRWVLRTLKWRISDRWDSTCERHPDGHGEH
jgi:hypothetical protein